MTDTTNGWPGKPGVPGDPGLPGAHWLKGYTEDAWMYDGDGGWWGPGYSHNLDAGTVAARYSYLGPCLTLDEAAALQARAVKWAGIVGTLMAERNQLIGALQIAVERSGDLEPTPSWLDGACGLLNQGFLKVDRAALEGKKA